MPSRKHGGCMPWGEFLKATSIPDKSRFRFPNPTDHLPLIYLRSSPPHNSRGDFWARWAHFFSGGTKPVSTSIPHVGGIIKRRFSPNERCICRNTLGVAATPRHASPRSRVASHKSQVTSHNTTQHTRVRARARVCIYKNSSFSYPVFGPKVGQKPVSTSQIPRWRHRFRR